MVMHDTKANEYLGIILTSWLTDNSEYPNMLWECASIVVAVFSSSHDHEIEYNAIHFF